MVRSKSDTSKKSSLAITPVIPAHPFELPPSGNTVIDFVNELGYPEPVEIVSNIRVNYVYQPWRAILSLINPRHPRDPDIFLTQSKSQRQSEEPKEESNSSPHSLWTVFQGKSQVYPNGDIWKWLLRCKENLKKVQACNLANQEATQKPTTTTPVKQSKPAPSPTKKPSKHDEAQQESIPHEEGNDPDLERAKKMSLEALQEQREGEGDDADLERAIKLSLDPAFLPQGRAP
ncbi:hypothetical protein Tco_1399348, partial [Tanacetum coccineum]